MKPFLGPYGAATIVLFTSQFDSELPKLSDLKRLLQIPDGTYYRSTGHHSTEVGHLEQVLTILRAPDANPNRYTYRRKTLSTDFLITVAGVNQSLFMTLKYSAQVVAGFNLTTQAVEELAALLKQHHCIWNLRENCESWPSTLQDQMQEAQSMGLTDTSILEADFEAVRRVTKDYGLEAIQTSVKALEQWYETYQWKHVPPGSDHDDGTASEDPLSQHETTTT
jgi:hypothetical protein